MPKPSTISKSPHPVDNPKPLEPPKERNSVDPAKKSNPVKQSIHPLQSPNRSVQQ
jgi:hypothetical protein